MNERLRALSSWHADWSGLRVAVLGLGATGFSVADTLTELGAEVLVLAEDASEEYRALVSVIGAGLYTGPLVAVPEALRALHPEVVVVSPGFGPGHPIVRWCQEQSGTALWGDVELAWRLRDKVTGADSQPVPWALVTGSRGKTTVTRLAATMLAEAGLRAAPSGDFGVPVLDAIRDPGGFHAHIVEVSARRLWPLAHSAPAGQPVPLASLCLNVGQPHPRWHGDASSHREAMALVYRNTLVACVYNKADIATRQMVEEADVVEGARAIGFDLGSPGPSDLGVVDGLLVDRAFHEDRLRSAIELATVEELDAAWLSEAHMMQSVLAAAALARALGAPPEAINAALRRAS